MSRPLAALAAFALASSPSIAATEAENQATSFANLYASLCIKHLPTLDVLRGKLKAVPPLPPEKAAPFLSGQEGDAWPIPDPHGTFVLALPTGKNFCALHARRADTEAAKKHFTGLVAKPPAPIVAKQVRNEHAQTPANGRIHTLAYEWTVPNSPKKMLFTLTTAPSESAQLQVLGSAAIVGE